VQLIVSDPLLKPILSNEMIINAITFGGIGIVHREQVLLRKWWGCGTRY